MRLGLIIRAALQLIRRTVLAGARRKVEVVRYDTGPQPRQPFHAPLRIAVVGDVAREKIESEIRPFGLEFVFLRIPEHLREQQCPHIVVCEANDLARTVAAAFRRESGAEPPALIMSIGGNWALIRRLRSVPKGTAVLAVRTSHVSSLLQAITEYVAHDLPLERAIKEGVRPLIGRRRGILLVIDRAINDALRLADAIEMLAIQRELAGSLLTAEEKESFQNLWQIASAHETEGPNNYGPRLLDISVMRATYRPDVPRSLERGTTLGCAANYLLEVHVGARLASSVIRGEEEPRGMLPGESEPDVLDVVVEDKELKVLSSRTHQLTLPRNGSSRMVFFAFRTPDKTGTASLRLIVYRRNQMLQSYLVEGEITENEVELGAADRGVTAKMDFSQSRDLTLKATNKERSQMEVASSPILTISVNSDAAATHAIFVKGAEGAVGFSIPELGVNRNIRRFRRILLKASYEAPKKPRRWPTQPVGDSETYIKELADFGSDMYRAYFDNTTKKLHDTLHSIRTTSDGVVSVIRYDERFAFPWPVFYEMYLPRIPWSASVRFGESAPGVSCEHNGESRAYCIRGFWGYRHRVEELIGNREPQDRVVRVTRQKTPGSLCFFADSSVQNATEIEGVLTRLQGSLKAQPADSATLLKMLWNNTARPALLVVFGHLTSKVDEGEPLGPRIPLPLTNPPDWLLSRDILEFLDTHAPWQDPNTVVVLLTCESAATTPETLTDFVIAFNRAKAGAIIGTECLALSDCVARFSERFFPLVWNGGMSIGEAMTEVRRALLQQGYPLAFVFSCIGRADLKVD